MTKPLIVITGASSGIGAAIAREFSAAGHPLLLLARRHEYLKQLGLPNTLCRRVDVSDREALSQAVDDAELEYGPVDGFINNAGCMLLGELDTQQPSEWQRMFDINVIGVLNGIQSVLPSMKARKFGTIINVSSRYGRAA